MLEVNSENARKTGEAIAAMFVRVQADLTLAAEHFEKAVDVLSHAFDRPVDKSKEEVRDA